MQKSQIGAKFAIPFANNAGASYKRIIPKASQISIEAGRASLTDGFPPLNFQQKAAGGAPPFGSDLNGLLYQMTDWLRWLQAGGPVAFDAAFVAEVGGYPQGAVLASSEPGMFWVSKVDDNVADPTVDAANWILMPGAGVARFVSLSGLTASPAGIDAFSTAIRAQKLNWVAAAGTANAISLTLTPAPSEWAALIGVPIRVICAARNTGPVTLAITGCAGTKSIVRGSGEPLAPDDLIPSVVMVIVYDGDKVRMLTLGQKEFPQIVANPTIYLRPDGNDANDGSANDAAHAMLTLQAALNRGVAQFFLAGKTLKLKLAPGTYAGNLVVSNVSGAIIVEGDAGNEAAYVLQGNGAGLSAAFTAEGAKLTLKGVMVSNIGTTSATVAAQYGGSLWLDHVTLTNVGGNTNNHIHAFPGGSIIPLYVTIAASMGGAFATSGGDITCPNGSTQIVAGTPNFSIGFAIASTAGALTFNGSMAGAATGPRYYAAANGVINTNGGTLPGSTAGSTVSGGQYL